MPVGSRKHAPTLPSRQLGPLPSRERKRAVAAVAAVACAITVGLLHAQSPPAFEVASIRQNPVNPGGVGSTQYCGGIQYLSGGRFTVTNCQLILMIQQIYGLRDFQIVGAPKWISEGNTSRYDIQARAADSPSTDQLRLMAQTLLAERFQLKVHRETRALPVYALVVGGNGPTFQASKGVDWLPGSGGVQSFDAGKIRGTHVVMVRLVEELSRRLERTVVDKTNFTEPFDFKLEWNPDQHIAGGSDPAIATRPSLFTAVQEQLGLKLEAQKSPIEVLVIDHVEQPSGN